MDEFNTSALPSPTRDDDSDAVVPPSDDANNFVISSQYNNGTQDDNDNNNNDDDDEATANLNANAVSNISMASYTTSVSPPPMFSAVQISEMGGNDPFPSKSGTDLPHPLYDQQSFDQNPSSTPNQTTPPNPFDDDVKSEDSPPPPIDTHADSIAKGFTEDFNGLNMSPVGIPPPVYSNETNNSNIAISNSTTNVATEPASQSSNDTEPASAPVHGSASPPPPHFSHAGNLSHSQSVQNVAPNNNTYGSGSGSGRVLSHQSTNSQSDHNNPIPLPKRVSTEPELFRRVHSPKTPPGGWHNAEIQLQNQQSKGRESRSMGIHSNRHSGGHHQHHPAASMGDVSKSLKATPENESLFADKQPAAFAHQSHPNVVHHRSNSSSHSRVKSARMSHARNSALKINKMAKGRSADDMMGQRADTLLDDVSFDDVLGQAVVGVEMADRLKEVIRKFCKHQQMGADKLQEIYLKLPPTYKKMDGLQECADLCALVHELIMQTVSAQKRLADFLVKDVVPSMDNHIKEKQQQIQRLKHDNRQAEMKLKNAVNLMERASNQAKSSAQRAKQLALASSTANKYGSGTQKKKNAMGVNLTGVFNKLKNNPHSDLPEEEQAYLKAQKLHKDYEAAVMAANYEQDTYRQIQGRFKRECKELEKSRLRNTQRKIQQFVNAHRSYFGSEQIMVLQTRIMSALDALNPDQEFESFLQRTIQKNTNRGNAHKPSQFVMTKYDYQNVFHSLQDSMDITMKLQPDRKEKIPLMVTVLCDKVRALNGFKTEGIFRKSAMATEIARLKGKLNQDDYKLDTKSPHVAACLLKDWLRGLKDSLIPQTHYDMAIDMAKKGTVKQESLEVFLSQLPEVNRETIKYLAKFLQDLIKEENVGKTKMNLENVAIVFGPTILKCPHSDNKILLANSRYEKSFVSALINELQDY